MTGLSRKQVTRLIGRHQESGMVKELRHRRHQFVRRYTAEDIIAEVDEVHETVSGPATQKILETGDWHRSRCRTFTTCARASLLRTLKICHQKTKPVKVNLGERRVDIVFHILADSLVVCLATLRTSRDVRDTRRTEETPSGWLIYYDTTWSGPVSSPRPMPRTVRSAEAAQTRCWRVQYDTVGQEIRIAAGVRPASPAIG